MKSSRKIFTVFQIYNFIRHYCDYEKDRLEKENGIGVYPLLETQTDQLVVIQNLLPKKSYNIYNSKISALASFALYGSGRVYKELFFSLSDVYGKFQKESKETADKEFAFYLIGNLGSLSDARNGKMFGGNVCMLDVIFDILA